MNNGYYTKKSIYNFFRFVHFYKNQNRIMYAHVQYVYK